MRERGKVEGRAQIYATNKNGKEGGTHDNDPIENGVSVSVMLFVFVWRMSSFEGVYTGTAMR
jgi:hypothetical protein